MQNTRKIFNEGLNADDDFSVISKGQWINASNVRIITTDSGATGRVEAIGGTSNLFSALPNGTNRCIGAVADEARKRIIFANWNSEGDHAIYAYDKTVGTTYKLIENIGVEGGLNFDKYFRIDTNMKIVDNLLIYTDNYNEPRKINIERGIKTYQPGYPQIRGYLRPLKYTVISLIKRPPIYPLNVSKFYDSAFVNNYIEETAYQFTYRYRYYDNEKSPLAAYSLLIPFNYKAENYNSVKISLPFSEHIEDDVHYIDICVRYGNTGKTFVIKSYDKDKDDDAIRDHNLNLIALAFTFYDDVNGIALDEVEANKSFDNIPLLTETIEHAKDRLFFGNNKLGYTTPTVTSLQVTTGSYDVGSGGTHTADWKYFTLTYQDNLSGAQNTVTYYYAYVSSLIPSAFYYAAQTGPTPPPSLNSSAATTAWNTETQLAAYIQRNYPPPAGSHWVYGPFVFTPTGATTDIIFSVNLNGLLFFKSGSTYKVSIAFYDRFRRKCGIVNKDIQITTPSRTATQTVFAGNIVWTLSNANTENEIPDWAYYYQIHISKNRTIASFMQFWVEKTDYVLKLQTPDATTKSLYDYGNSSFSLNNTYAVGFDLTPLTAAGLGYSFTEGDLLRVYKTDGTNILLKILGTDGNFVLVSAQDLGTLDASHGFLIEIYTPTKPSETEPLYETGDVYNINNPGTSSRTYETLTGSINGDAYAIQRDKGGSTLYYTEAMSPRDKLWKIWQTDTGWPNIVDTIGQVQRTNSILFSDTYISGTKVNGLNVVQPLNEIDLDAQTGSIQKLQLASKVQQDGTVMLAICSEETISCYLGEQELFDAQGSAAIVKSSNVIGTTKALRGSLGTANPESVFEYNGLVFWWDIKNGCAVQYSDNGLFPISKNKMVRPSNLFSRKFASLYVPDFSALGSDPFIVGGFDPYHKEVLFTIPSTEASPKGELIDYPGVVYPYDIYDGKGKTLIYKHEYDMWLGSMPIEAEMFMNMDNDLYGFKNGQLYIFNQPNTCNLFGTQYTAKIMYPVNPGAIHTYYSLGLESNKKPIFVHLRTEDPYEQSSDLISTDFVSHEGMISSSLFMDRLSPNQTGTYSKKQVSGDRLFGKALLVMLEYEFVTDQTKLQLRAVNTGNKVNTGTLLNKI